MQRPRADFGERRFGCKGAPLRSDAVDRSARVLCFVGTFWVSERINLIYFCVSYHGNFAGNELHWQPQNWYANESMFFVLTQCADFVSIYKYPLQYSVTLDVSRTEHPF